MFSGSITERLPRPALQCRGDLIWLTVAEGVEARTVASAVLRLVHVQHVRVGEDPRSRLAVDEQRDATVVGLWQRVPGQFGDAVQRRTERVVTDEVARQRGHCLL